MSFPSQYNLFSINGIVFIKLIFILPDSDQPIPHTASCALSENGREAFFALAYQNNMVLYTMNSATGQVALTELKESYIVPRILTNFTGAFR